MSAPDHEYPNMGGRKITSELPKYLELDPAVCLPVLLGIVGLDRLVCAVPLLDQARCIDAMGRQVGGNGLCPLL